LVNVHQARSPLSQLLQEVEQGLPVISNTFTSLNTGQPGGEVSLALPDRHPTCDHFFQEIIENATALVRLLQQPCRD